MDEGGVDAAVIHPPGWDPGSTDMAFAAVRDYPGRFAIMGALPLDRSGLARTHSALAGAAGDAGAALRVPAAIRARQWLHDGTPRLAMGGSRKGRCAGRRAGDGLARGAWPRSPNAIRGCA